MDRIEEENEGTMAEENLENDRDMWEVQESEAVGSLFQMDAEIRRLNFLCKVQDRQYEILKGEKEAMEREKEYRLAMIEKTKTMTKCMEDECKVRENNIKLQKQVCELLFEKKHEIKRKTAEAKEDLEEKQVKWTKMMDDSKKRIDGYEEHYLSMPWAAEYKALYDEDKRAKDELAFSKALVEEKKKEIAEKEASLAKTDPINSWNKTCVQFANDMVHARRMTVELEKVKAKISEMKKIQDNGECQPCPPPPPEPSTPVRVAAPPKTPQTVPSTRQSTFKTPTIAPSVPKTPQSCQPALVFKTPSSTTVQQRRTAAISPCSPFKTPRLESVTPHSPFKTPRTEPSPNCQPSAAPTSPHSPAFMTPRLELSASPHLASSKTPHASPRVNQSAQFKVPTPLANEAGQSRYHSPAVPRPQQQQQHQQRQITTPPPSASRMLQSPNNNDFFNLGGLGDMLDEGGSSPSDSSEGTFGSRFGGSFQLDFGNNDDEDENNSGSASGGENGAFNFLFE